MFILNKVKSIHSDESTKHTATVTITPVTVLMSLNKYKSWICYKVFISFSYRYRLQIRVLFTSQIKLHYGAVTESVCAVIWCSVD